MALKFRRTLSMEDLVCASDEEMDDLLQNCRTENEVRSNGGEKIRSHKTFPDISPDESEDILFQSPNVPILSLDDSNENSQADDVLSPMSTTSNNAGAGSSLPKSKSVRFQDLPEDSDKIKQFRNQVDEVKGVMRDNVTRLLDREANLDSLADISDQLNYTSDVYRHSSEHLRRKLWWRQQRSRLILGGVIVLCICLIFIPVMTKLLNLRYSKH